MARKVGAWVLFALVLATFMSGKPRRRKAHPVQALNCLRITLHAGVGAHCHTLAPRHPYGQPSMPHQSSTTQRRTAGLGTLHQADTATLARTSIHKLAARLSLSRRTYPVSACVPAATLFGSDGPPRPAHPQPLRQLRSVPPAPPPTSRCAAATTRPTPTPAPPSRATSPSPRRCVAAWGAWVLGHPLPHPTQTRFAAPRIPRAPCLGR